MAADVDIREFNGASPGTPATVKTGGTLQLKNVDDAVVESPLTHPTVRPAASSVYSYEKALRLRIGATGPPNLITSPRAYGDGVNNMPTGATFRAGTAGSYTQPIKMVSGTATTLWTTYTSASPLALDVVNTGPYSGTNVDIADFLYLQIELASTAADPPTTGTEPIVLAYDET